MCCFFIFGYRRRNLDTYLGKQLHQLCKLKHLNKIPKYQSFLSFNVMIHHNIRLYITYSRRRSDHNYNSKFNSKTHRPKRQHRIVNVVTKKLKKYVCDKYYAMLRFIQFHVGNVKLFNVKSEYENGYKNIIYIYVKDTTCYRTQMHTSLFLYMHSFL